MSKPIVFVLDPYYDEALKKLEESDAVDVVHRDDPRIQEWRSEAAAIMIRSETTVTESDLAEAKKLKVVVKQGVGVDNIDLDAAKRHGIIVCNTPALNSESVAELTIALALCIARRVTELDRKIRQGEKVLRGNVLGRSLYRKAIGIVGMGNIGKVVAQKWAAAMEGRIIAYDPYAPDPAWPGIDHRRVHSLDDLLNDADVVSLHVPLSSSTRKMMGKAQFDQMKAEAIFLVRN